MNGKKGASMIRKLIEEDRREVLEFLRKEASINLFIIGDIEIFGFEKDFMEVWGSYNKGNLEGVLLRFYENFIPYYKDKAFDIDDFKKIIRSYKGKRVISGRQNIVERFRGIIEIESEKNDYFCELLDSRKLDKEDIGIKRAVAEDASRIYELLESIEEFSATPSAPIERIAKMMEERAGRVYYLENEEKEMISIGQTTAENSRSAMIVGVATKLKERRKGYTSKCLSKLCGDLIQEGKTLCLFYDNPVAGNIYHRLGFKTIDRWLMLIGK